MSWTTATAVSSSFAGACQRATIAGHAVTVDGMAGGLVNLRIDLRGEPLIALARSLVKLDGVRVTGGPEGTGRGRCYVVSCLGFRMVLSPPVEGSGDVALALVSREPRPPLAVLSELGSVLDRLLSAPPPSPPPASPLRGRVTSEEEEGDDQAEGEVARSSLSSSSSSLRRSALRPGKGLARRTELKRKTPLGRGPFRRP
jgi:hypothetical protein